MSSYDIKDQLLIVVASAVLHNFIRIHDRKDKRFKWDKSISDDLESNDMKQGIPVVRKTLAIYMMRRL
jgi:hypothetical protein